LESGTVNEYCFCPIGVRRSAGRRIRAARERATGADYQQEQKTNNKQE